MSYPQGQQQGYYGAPPPQGQYGQPQYPPPQQQVSPQTPSHCCLLSLLSKKLTDPSDALPTRSPAPGTKRREEPWMSRDLVRKFLHSSLPQNRELRLMLLIQSGDTLLLLVVQRNLRVLFRLSGLLLLGRSANHQEQGVSECIRAWIGFERDGVRKVSGQVIFKGTDRGPRSLCLWYLVRRGLQETYCSNRHAYQTVKFISSKPLNQNFFPKPRGIRILYPISSVALMPTADSQFSTI
ncbi:hypothetical protein BCR34DRAFT_241468 [Clohesyomyces aquaticus]|uniref:Uncharacterized protein n=1 Tax=Clohesyomyces aquaticus TaxID=1231657 RepID=A0A1Y1ZVD1_9PLEO|nr:hypothetical protein BCR34DRAFT_241468 [Clohesyomyces aquaticus]